MNTTVEQIRSALSPYVAETGGLAGFPEDLVDLLEDPTDEAKDLAERLEGMLALYGLKRISEDFLKKEIRVLLAENTPIQAVQVQTNTFSPPSTVQWFRFEFVVRSNQNNPPPVPPAPAGSNWASLPNAGNTATYCDTAILVNA